MKQKYHFIGIGGIGMSGLARILLSRQQSVTGSDLTPSYVTDGLEKAGAKIIFQHSSDCIEPDMIVVYSSDIKKDNVEYCAALQKKCTLLHRSDLLLQLMQDSHILSVSGTHGKTTTTALLASTLLHGGFDPSFAVGGILPHTQTNAGHGEGKYFVAEADESDGTFLKYPSYGAIVTNIDLDHMDHFGSEERLIQAFRTFMAKVSSPQHLFWCGDDVRLASLGMPGIRYGFGEQCLLKGSNFHQEGWSISFDAQFQGKKYERIQVPLTGKHNALNALAVFGLALSLGMEESRIRAGFAAFRGVLRRCEKKGEARGILLLDDYAHHPTEIRTTLNAIRRAVSTRRLVAIFQPHRYTRTKLCLGTFGGIFDEADEVIITDIYGARETPIPGVTHETVMEEVRAHSNVSCKYVPRKELAETLVKELRAQDVAVTLGAGDITKLSAEVLEKLK